MSIPQPLDAAGYGLMVKGLVTSSKQRAFDVRERKIPKVMAKWAHKEQKLWASIGEEPALLPFVITNFLPTNDIVRYRSGATTGRRSYELFHRKPLYWLVPVMAR